jgi:hypothetical protein
MGIFLDLCRNLGLMVHHIAKPEGDGPAVKKVLKKDVQEQREGNMILRRTTIEEIEIRPDPPAPPSPGPGPDKPNQA